MRFLLTSAGITNKSISNAIIDLVGKPAHEIKFIFIPTAANPEEGDKSWLIENIEDFKKQEYASVDILDIAGVPQSVWLPRFEAADLICFGGGNEQYLAKIIRESGVEKSLPTLLKSRVYMGISAGSMVVGQYLSQKVLKTVYAEEVFDELAPPLGYVDCLFIPHLNSEYFTHVRKEVLEALTSEFTFPLYAVDDNSALKIIDKKIEIVSEGEVLVFKK